MNRPLRIPIMILGLSVRLSHNLWIVHPAFQTRDYWTGILTGAPGIQAALIWMVAIPLAVSGGRRKFTWYPSTEPGYPTAARTSPLFPLTVTANGEFTTARGLEGKGSPGSRLVRVGPRPVANIDRISPAVAGFEGLTSEKSFEWTMAGPLAVIATSGRDSGITNRTNRTCPPPFRRRLAGSSVIEARRALTAPFNKLFLPPFWPRAPKNAPVPPTIAKFWLATAGPGGVGDPLFSPVTIILPTGVTPSLCRIS
jgi:hypothetical protein